MQPPLVTARVLWAAILSSVGVMFVVLRVAEHPSEPQKPELFPIFGFFALSVAAASVLLPARLHAEVARAQRLETREEPNTVTPDAPSATRRVFVEPEKARAVAWRLFMSPFIISLALSEAVALSGFVLGFSGFPEERVLPFFLVSAVLLALRFPKASAAEKMLEKSLGATF
jgi:hypothetical protein